MQNAEAVMTDADWAPHARQMRAAVIRMRGGHPEKIYRKERCLPGEPGDCGHSNAEHIIGWYAQLSAMMAHNAEHLAATLGRGYGAMLEMHEQAYESFVCAAAADSRECWHWRDMHGECPGPVKHT